MLFSIIVPIYKVEKYIRQCVDSILAQTFPDFELILVDDGSPDNCPKICDEYAEKDKRVKVIHLVNSGVVIARQTGVNNANGEYLLFVDGDDSIAFNCLEVIAKYAYVDVIRFGFYREKPSGYEKTPISERVGYYSKGDIEREIFPKLIQTVDANYYIPSVWVAAFRKELFVKNMLTDIRLAVGEDGACVIPCIYHAQSLYIIEDCLYNYRLNYSSVTKSRKVLNWNGPEIIAKHLAEKLDLTRYDLQEQLYRKIVHELFSVVVSQFNRKEKYKTIKQDIKVNLKNPIYDEAVKNAMFSHSIKAKLMHQALKYRWFLLIKIFNNLKYKG